MAANNEPANVQVKEELEETEVDDLAQGDFDDFEEPSKYLLRPWLCNVLLANTNNLPCAQTGPWTRFHLVYSGRKTPTQRLTRTTRSFRLWKRWSALLRRDSTIRTCCKSGLVESNHHINSNTREKSANIMLLGSFRSEELISNTVLMKQSEKSCNFTISTVTAQYKGTIQSISQWLVWCQLPLGSLNESDFLSRLPNPRNEDVLLPPSLPASAPVVIHTSE